MEIYTSWCQNQKLMKGGWTAMSRVQSWYNWWKVTECHPSKHLMRHFITRQDLARLARQKKTMKSLQVQVFRNILHNEDVCNSAAFFCKTLPNWEGFFAFSMVINPQKNEACRPWALFRKRNATIWTQKKPFPHFPYRKPFVRHWRNSGEKVPSISCGKGVGKQVGNRFLSSPWTNYIAPSSQMINT